MAFALDDYTVGSPLDADFQGGMKKLAPSFYRLVRSTVELGCTGELRVKVERGQLKHCSMVVDEF